MIFANTISGMVIMNTKTILSTVISTLIFITGLSQIAVAVKTPKGANVYAVKKPSSTVLNAIDKGLTDLFAVARKNKYYNRLNYSDYSVYIGKADRTKDSTGQYSPDIAIGAAQYAGSVYDQGGYIYAAGMGIVNDSFSS